MHLYNLKSFFSVVVPIKETEIYILRMFYYPCVSSFTTRRHCVCQIEIKSLDQTSIFTMIQQIKIPLITFCPKGLGMMHLVLILVKSIR